MADIFYTVPQAYNISRDQLFLVWLFPAHGESPGGVNLAGLSPYADNNVALYGDTVASVPMEDFEAIHDLRRRGTDLDIRDLADRLLEITYGTDQLVPQVPVSLFVASRRMEGFPVDLVPRYRTALANIAGPNEQEPVRAHTDRDSDLYKYSVLAWWRKFGANDPLLHQHSDLDRLLRAMLYTMTPYACTNPFLASDTDPLYTSESRNLRIDTMRWAFPMSSEVYAGVARIDVEIVTTRELLRGDTPEANTRRHRVRDGNTALIYIPKALEWTRG
ncbi:hypothetical protein GNI_080060 [Gregarina niphandrodes]|uniref:Uncharacterized protein n=1 Tax=Gregarina niphandrodes TaxID=110365 RepID=A0A023B6G0_GRENI|nr:hypothetical protein GNI_080060 [Gregarina niphandrodes]EZG66530.1 hypothetical protein GNI_080060 [Gregarina niphandrodes]|eukprot:XP_011130624.1 hypothetical protein GNI_080060 [Gregarina niphandrodes]